MTSVERRTPDLLATPFAAFENPLSVAGQARATARRGADWLKRQIDPATGSFGLDALDLAAYAKAPACLHLAGRSHSAHLLLDFIAGRFLQRDGDFLTAPSLKTRDAVLARHPGHLNAWIVLGAHRLARFDVSSPGWGCLRGFQDPASGAGVLQGPWFAGTESQREMLTTAQLGLAALCLGERSTAIAAGDALLRFYQLQPVPLRCLYLRMDASGALITACPPKGETLYRVDSYAPGQAWFSVGYPIACLTLLYQATGERRFVQGARDYADFTLRCGIALTTEHFGHAAGWGTALLAKATGARKYRDLAEAVAQSLIVTQASDGGWLPDAPRVTRLDQTAEVVQWLLEISALL
jgi:hypothetical protein